MTDHGQMSAERVLFYTRCPAPTATGLAVGLGLLAPALSEHRVSLWALQDVPDEELRRRHFDHRITNLVREGGNIPAIWAYSSGEPTRLLGITWLDEYQAIVTAASSPLEELTDLAGRRVAVPRSGAAMVDVSRASTLRGFEAALSTVGLDLDSIRLVDSAQRTLSGPSSSGRGENFDSELDLLAEGAVDAVWLKGAAGLAAVQSRGLRVLFRIDLESDPLVRVNNGTPRTITARQELIEEDPGLVVTYLEALLGAPAHLEDDRRSLWRVLASETHQRAEDAEAAYIQVDHSSLVPSLHPERLAGLQHQADFLFAQGFILNPVDVRAWSSDLTAAHPVGV